MTMTPQRRRPLRSRHLSRLSERRKAASLRAGCMDSRSERSAKDARPWPSRSPRTSPETWKPRAWWTRRMSIASLSTRSYGRPVRSPICAPFLHFSLCGRGPLPRLSASAGEQVAEVQVVCQVLKRLQMPIVGPHSSLPPTPYGDGIYAETTGDLHP